MLKGLVFAFLMTWSVALPVARASGPMTLREARELVSRADLMVPPDWDETRLRGFYEHRRGQEIFDVERRKAESLWVEGLERWERERLNALAERRKEAKSQSPQEDGPEHKEHLRERRIRRKEHESARADYVRTQRAAAMLKKDKPPVSDLVELGLDQKRPRFDVTKRALYTGKGVGAGRAGSSGGGSFGGGGSSPGSSPNFVPSPPPANFDDFPEPPPMDGGYVPPPPLMGEDDMPPPPMFDEGDFPPPPPPPPPDFGDFPPPPPPEGF